MLAIWYLVIALGGGTTTIPDTYPSLDACRAAAAEAQRDNTDAYRFQVLCVPAGDWHAS